jgi:hypothetical protein
MRSGIWASFGFFLLLLVACGSSVPQTASPEGLAPSATAEALVPPLIAALPATTSPPRVTTSTRSVLLPSPETSIAAEAVPLPSGTASQAGGGAGQQQAETSVEVLHLPELDRLPPADILTEVIFFGGGMGSGKLCEHHEQPEVLSAWTQAELFGFVLVITCGWQPGEWVGITLSYPDGRTEFQEIQAHEVDGEVFLHHQVAVEDPTGEYTLQFQGKSGQVVHSFVVTEPSGPRLYKLDENRLLLYNFAPYEQIRFFVYELDEETPYTPDQIQRLIAWQEFQVGSNGQLLVELGQDIMEGRSYGDCVVLGSISGEVKEFHSTSMIESILREP